MKGRVRLTRRGKALAAVIVAALAVWLYAVSVANFEECRARGYSVAVCSE